MMNVLNLSRSRFASNLSWLVVSLVIPATLTQPAQAGSEPVSAAQGGASSTGTVNFSFGAAGDVTPQVQQSLNQVVSSVRQTLSNVSQGALAGPPLSSSKIEEAITALENLTVLNRRSEQSFASVRGIVLEYEGNLETAELTTQLLSGLASPGEQSLSSLTTASVMELTLGMQGLLADGRVNPERLLSSIEAFNQMINQLSPEQLVNISENQRLLELKQALGRLAKAAEF